MDRRERKISTDLEEVVQGAMHPANGFMLVQLNVNERASGIILPPGVEQFHSGVVIEVSKDDQNSVAGDGGLEWGIGDLIFFKEYEEVDGHTLVHWLEVYAFRSFSEGE